VFLLVLYFFLLIIAGASVLAMLVLYCVTLSRMLGRCSPERRVLTPGLVWLLLIPVIGYLWHFVLVISISISLKREFSARRIVVSDNPGLTVGLPMCIAMISHLILIFFIPSPGLIKFLLISASLVLWIVYWIIISRYSGKLLKAKSRKK
jgi:hypothetical protein